MQLQDRHQGSALVQRSAPKNQMPSPIANFAGVGANGAVPPDTEGDIGPDYYMQWVNLQFRIFHRDGTPATPATPGYQLFTGQPICGSPSGNGGDPIVLYDHFAQRWIAAQLAYPTYPNGPFYQCVAYSSTSDPTGTWCAYQYLAHQTNLNDYPKFGVWPAQHAYMITVNQFHEPGDAWAGVGVFALERDALMSGCGSARMLYKDMLPVEPNLWGGMLPADADGATLAARKRAGAADRGRRPGDGIRAHFPVDRLDDLERDGRLGGAGTINVSHEGPTPDGAVRQEPLQLRRACIPQPGTTEKLDSLGDRLMYRLAYRNFGDHEALVVNHSVDADGADRAGVRWYELRNPTTGTWSIYQQGTYAPDTTATAGWAASRHGPRRQHGRRLQRSSSDHADSRASATPGRLATDPLGAAGAGRGDAHHRHRLADGRRNRWGDYSDDDGRPDRRLHLLVHERVPGQRPVATVADAHRQLQVPVLRWAPRRHLRLRLPTAAATASASATATAATSAATSTTASAATTASTSATSAASAATASAATASAAGPLPRPTRPRTAPRRREDEDPARALLGRQRPPRSLQALAARPCRQPVTAARHDQAPELPGQAGGRPRLVRPRDHPSGVLSERRL